MWDKKILQMIAVFMISLIISMPLYVGNASAAQITVEKAVGSDGIDGFVKEDDVLTVEVLANDGDDEVSPSQVLLVIEHPILPGGSYETAFKECPEKKLGSSVCTISTEIARASEIITKVELYNDEGSKIATAGVDYDIDTKKPVIDYFDIFQGDGTTYVQYKVRDSGSGLDRILFYADNVCVLEKEVEGETSVQSHNQSLDVSHGDHTFYIKVYDKLGNYAVSNKGTKNVDYAAPSIESMHIIDANGNDIEYIQPGEKTAKVILRVEEENIVENAFADLSGLVNPYLAAKYRNRQGSCLIREIGYYDCEWVIPLYVSASGSKTIKFYVEDDRGNELNISRSYEFNVDSAAPVLRELKSTAVDDDSGQMWVGLRNNTIIAEIVEEGSGLENKNVRLSSNDMVGGPYIPNKCDKLSSRDWRCEWNYIQMSDAKRTGDSVMFNIGWPSADDAGNLFGGAMTAKFDEDAPVAAEDDVTVTAFGGALYLKSEDAITVIAYVEDDTEVTGTADFSQVINGVGKRTVKCKDLGDGRHECRWDRVGPLVRGPLDDVPIEFTFSDLVGNKKEDIVKHIDIAAEAGEELLLWKEDAVDISPSVDYIDNTVAEYTPGGIKIYVSGKLENHGSVSSEALKAVDISFRECKDTIDYDYLEEEPYLFIASPMTGEGMQAPIDLYMVFNLRKGEIPKKNLTFECSVDVISRYQQTIYPTQTVNFAVTLDVEESGLDLTSHMRDEIDDMKDKLKKGKWIGTIESFFDTIKKLCKIINSVYGALRIFSIAKGPVGTVLEATVVGKPWAKILDAAEGGISTEADGVLKYAGHLCKYASCRHWDTGEIEWPGGKDKLKDIVWKSYESAINTYIRYTSLRGVGLDTTKLFGPGYDVEESLNPENSIFLSAMTLCVPGVLYNMEKARQIDCMYVDCMENWVAAGTDPFVCQSLQYTMKCKYVIGQVFNLFPIAQFADKILDAVKEIISDPLGWLGISWGYICWRATGSGLKSACHISRSAKIIADIYNDVTSTFASWKDDKDYCKIVLEDDEE